MDEKKLWSYLTKTIKESLVARRVYDYINRYYEIKGCRHEFSMGTADHASCLKCGKKK